MGGKIYADAYYALDHNQITLLSFLMAFADNSGLINVAKWKILELTNLNEDEYTIASEFLLGCLHLNKFCSAEGIDRITWSDDLALPYFTTTRFLVIWDTERLNSYQLKKLKEIVFERDNYTCQYCHKRGGVLQCDHIHPICKGGSNDLENLTTACAKCNRSKHGKTLSEWRA